MIEESIKRLDSLFATAFDANHPAMLDWAAVKIELKKLQGKPEEELCNKHFYEGGGGTTLPYSYKKSKCPGCIAEQRHKEISKGYNLIGNPYEER